MTSAEHLIVFDIEQRRPGCVLLQVALGGDVPRDLFAELFPHTTWLVSPTDSMAAYRATDDQLRQLAVMARVAVEGA
jgi:hypothetical protein